MKYSLRLPAVLALFFAAFTAQASEIQISDAWIRAAPPNAPALGAFMQIENSTDAERYLVDARTSLEVERVELHRTKMLDGVMQMVPQAKIPLAPASKTMLEPGSWHVMLIGPKSVPTEGETVQVTLVFDDGSEQAVEAVVRKGKQMMHSHQHKHDCEQKHKHAQQQMQGQEHKPDCAPGMSAD
jgi:copper(I)-binding protein